MKEDIFLADYKKLLEDLLEILEVELDELTEQEKELLIAYSFGMISIMAEENNITLDTQYTSVKKTIMEVFQYSKQEAEKMMQNLLDSNKECSNEALKIMIHQGKFVYPKYKAKSYNEVYDRLTNMIDVIVSGEYKNY